MTDIVKIEEKEIREINEGRKAGDLLNDPTFAKALEEVRQNSFKEFETSEPEDTGKREMAYFRLRAIKEVERNLSKKRSRGAISKQKQTKRTREKK